MGSDKGSGLEPNIAGMLAYLFGWVTGLIFILIEPNDKFVRFHAMQSIIYSVVICVFSIVFGIMFLIPFVGWILFMILWIGNLIIWILCMVKAYQGERFKLPVIGDFAAKYS